MNATAERTGRNRCRQGGAATQSVHERGRHRNLSGEFATKGEKSQGTIEQGEGGTRSRRRSTGRKPKSEIESEFINPRVTTTPTVLLQARRGTT